MWITHKNHLNKLVLYDHVFFSNPSDQVEEKLPVVPDWTNLFFAEIIQRFHNDYILFSILGLLMFLILFIPFVLFRIKSVNGNVTVNDIFSSFDAGAFNAR
jgi:quinol-cytochrome oxidoreductase complex cytochrome b subunit